MDTRREQAWGHLGKARDNIREAERHYNDGKDAEAVVSIDWAITLLDAAKRKLKKQKKLIDIP